MKVLRKTVLADSEGVMVAFVMLVITDRVSSSSALSAVLDETVEKLGDLAAGWGPLLSFYLISCFFIMSYTDPGSLSNRQSPLLSSHSSSYVRASIWISARLKTP